jgi:hypothetical protein
MREGIFLLLLLAAPAFAASDAMNGSWYTEGVENGIHAQFVIENGTDGTFTKRIRDVTRCNAVNAWNETGRWSFDGKVFSEITETVGGQKVDPSDPGYRDQFQMTQINPAHFSMFDPKTNVTWLLEKVPQNYAMPLSGGCAV